jgi:hypothetical protein
MALALCAGVWPHQIPMLHSCALTIQVHRALLSAMSHRAIWQGAVFEADTDTGVSVMMRFSMPRLWPTPFKAEAITQIGQTTQVRGTPSGRGRARGPCGAIRI